MKVFIVGTQYGYANWITDCEFVNNIEEADLVFFTGGADISASLYGCKQHKNCWTNPRRDAEEVDAFKRIRKDQLVWGTCRGLKL